MALVESSSYVNYLGTGAPIDIAKPTGLVVGDLLVAHITGASNSPTSQTGPAGWTKRSSGTTGGESWSLFTKTADAGDVSAVNFQFDSTDGEWIGGAVSRISGVTHDFTLLSSQNYGTSGVTATFNSADLTPILPNSLVLFFTFLQGTNSPASGWGMVNDNPTWTEVYSFGSTVPATDMSQGLAYAIRPQVTSTGDFFAVKSSSSGIIGTFLILSQVGVSPSASLSPSASESSSPSPSVSPSASTSPSSSSSPSRSPSASRSTSVSVSPSPSISTSVSPSPSAGVTVYNTSIITAVKRVQQDLAFPKFVMGGRGGPDGLTYALFKKSNTYGFSTFRFPVQRFTNEFDVLEIKFPIIPGLTAGMNILPILYFDNETNVIAGNQINISNYPLGTDFIVLTAKNFDNSVHGKSNFFLELRWLGTALATVGLPATFKTEVKDD